MKRAYLAAAAVAAVTLAVGGASAVWYRQRERVEQLHYEREETELIISDLARAPARLFKAGGSLAEAQPVPVFDGGRIWLSPGDYFLRVDQPGQPSFYPVPIAGYRRGPDQDGAFAATLRPAPPDSPPRLLPEAAAFAFIPSGHFLLGDRLNPREPHYVWLPAFFIGPFEVTNAEFRLFGRDPGGYADDANWTEAGRRWKAANPSQATALLGPGDAESTRFGQPDHPVVRVTWFEAAAFCRWLTRKSGQGRWLFALPSEAEWEKAARGPDGFDYGLGRVLSDHEVQLYNWKKNPGAPVTVIGVQDSQSNYRPNRYGLYHMSGNVVEWTASIHHPYNRDRPYVDEERNREDAAGLRVARGGSWYSASIALLYLPYRDAFQPEVRNHDLGFRVVARVLP